MVREWISGGRLSQVRSAMVTRPTYPATHCFTRRGGSGGGHRPFDQGPTGAPVVADAQDDVLPGDDADLDLGGRGVAGDVRQRLPEGGEQLPSDLLVDQGVDRPFERDVRQEPEGTPSLAGQRDDAVPQAGAAGGGPLQADDDRPDVLDRDVEVLDRVLDAGGHLGSRGQAGGALE